MTIFHGDDDFFAFEDLMRRANERLPLQVLAWCLMPNHFHLVVRPRGDRDLSRWMHWLLTAHVQRYRRRYNSTGRIWQGRFKAPPIPLPSDWCGFVNRPQTQVELAQINDSLRRGSPYGDAAWTRGTAERLGLLKTLNPRGHPIV